MLLKHFMRGHSMAYDIYQIKVCKLFISQKAFQSFDLTGCTNKKYDTPFQQIPLTLRECVIDIGMNIL